MTSPTLTDNEIRVTIAAHCGWTIEGDKWPDIYLHKPNGKVVRPSDPRIDAVDLLPDFLNDLQAMHEAEKVLTDAQKWKYLDVLVHALDQNSQRYVAFATARSRALAFYATVCAKGE